MSGFWRYEGFGLAGDVEQGRFREGPPASHGIPHLKPQRHGGAEGEGPPSSRAFPHRMAREKDLTAREDADMRDLRRGWVMEFRLQTARFGKGGRRKSFHALWKCNGSTG